MKLLSFLAAVVLAAIPAFAGESFSKNEFFSEPKLGTITDIEQLQNHQLVIVGQRGAVFMNQAGSPSARVSFNGCRSQAILVHPESGNDPSFLCKGRWTEKMMMFDARGNTRWEYGAGVPGIDDSSAGTIGPDGKKAVLVGFNGSGGVHLLDLSGKELWQRAGGNVWNAKIVPLDAKSGGVILHNGGNGELIVRDFNGDVVAHYRPIVKIWKFSLTSWGDDPLRNKLVASGPDAVFVLNLEGKVVASLSAPGNVERPDPPLGTPVRFAGGPADYASLQHNWESRQSLLFIYENQVRLVYNETLDGNCSSLLRVSNGYGKEDLLVGCEGKVWKYTKY